MAKQCELVAVIIVTLDSEGNVTCYGYVTTSFMSNVFYIAYSALHFLAFVRNLLLSIKLWGTSIITQD